MQCDTAQRPPPATTAQLILPQGGTEQEGRVELSGDGLTVSINISSLGLQTEVSGLDVAGRLTVTGQL